jgi:hypothetical protein
LINVTAQSDESLRVRLDGLSTLDKDYWSFKENCRRDHGHGFFQYPAMMVPKMVEVILDEICSVHPEVKWITDPFVGSGTILTETMLKGLSFAGRDVNPLAILLCRTKRGPFFREALRKATNDLLGRVKADRKRKVEIAFAGIDKWFRKDVQIGLSRIRRCIQTELSVWSRRFFWVALAETVRLTSNSRTSTFKLHIRPKSEIRSRKIDPVETFTRIVERNLSDLDALVKLLQERRLMEGGHYAGEIALTLGDSRQPLEPANGKCDVLITSPPYGDNVTTVPYGQFSFLPLQWIDLDDVDPRAKAQYLRTTHEIDSRSLGGSRRVDPATIESLRERSQTLTRLLARLQGEPSDRPRRVAAFFRDLNECLPQVLRVLRPGGLMIWVLGNRRVAGKKVPLDRILCELLEYHGAKRVVTLKRRIPSKRMALKNSVAKTMSAERILVMRKKA